MKIVDPTNPIPKYLQISTWLKELIQTGRYKPGEKLPSEIELSKICAVNRNTLRQAISELVSEGLLRKERGMGTFISSSMPVAVKHRLRQLSSFKNDLNESGLKVKTIILGKSLEEANERIAKALILGADNKVIVIRRLRRGNGIPFIYEENYFPENMFKDLLDLDLSDSIYKILAERFQIVLARSDQIIRAVNLKGKIATLLHLPENSAALFMERVTFDENNIPIELLYSYHRGDKCIFEVEAGRYYIKG